MKLNLSKIIFVFTLFFVFDINADKNIPTLEKDLYLHGTALFQSPSGRINDYEILIKLYNKYEMEEPDFEDYEFSFQCHYLIYESSASHSSIKEYHPECADHFPIKTFKEVVADIYFMEILTPPKLEYQVKIGKHFGCKVEYYGDGNEWIAYEGYGNSCVDKNNGGSVNQRLQIRRKDLITLYGYGMDKEIKFEFIEQETYLKRFQLLDEKFEAYKELVQEESVL